MDWNLVERRLDAYERLLRLDKPIGTLLLLWPTLWALWLAWRGLPSPEVIAIFSVGTSSSIVFTSAHYDASSSCSPRHSLAPHSCYSEFAASPSTPSCAR